MDEIDAALDFKNVSIVANYIKERTKNAQVCTTSNQVHPARIGLFFLSLQISQSSNAAISTKSFVLANSLSLSVFAIICLSSRTVWWASTRQTTLRKVSQSTRSSSGRSYQLECVHNRQQLWLQKPSPFSTEQIPQTVWYLWNKSWQSIRELQWTDDTCPSFADFIELLGSIDKRGYELKCTSFRITGSSARKGKSGTLRWRVKIIFWRLHPSFLVSVWSASRSVLICIFRSNNPNCLLKREARTTETQGPIILFFR